MFKYIPPNGLPWSPYTYALDPHLAKLNNATFASLQGRSAPAGTATGADVVGQEVYCHSYAHVVTFSNLTGMAGLTCAPRCRTLYDGRHGHGLLDDADGRPVNTTCFVLVDTATLFHSRTVSLTLNPYTVWCSLNGSGLGPGWLPLQWDTAEHLLQYAAISTDNHQRFSFV